MEDNCVLGDHNTSINGMAFKDMLFIWDSEQYGQHILLGLV